MTARVRQAHKPQSMFCSPAPCTRKLRTQHWPPRNHLAERFWGSKEDLVKTTNFINTIELGVCMRTILER